MPTLKQMSNAILHLKCPFVQPDRDILHFLFEKGKKIRVQYVHGSRRLIPIYDAGYIYLARP
jgi:hypothetical protein